MKSGCPQTHHLDLRKNMQTPNDIKLFFSCLKVGFFSDCIAGDTNDFSVFAVSRSASQGQSRQILWVVLKLLSCNWGQDAQETNRKASSAQTFDFIAAIVFYLPFFSPQQSQTDTTKLARRDGKSPPTRTQSQQLGNFNNYRNICPCATEVRYFSHA